MTFIFIEASRTRFLIPHFILLPPFAFPSAGAVDQIVLPEGMQTVNFAHCNDLTGTAELEDDGHIYLIRFGGQPLYILLSSLSCCCLFCFLPFRPFPSSF